MVASRIETFGAVTRVHMSRTIAGRPLQWTSVYRVGDAIVDSGCSSARAVFAKLVREGAPAAILTTHEHEDHIGNHAILPRDTIVHAPALAREFLESGHPRFPLYRRVVWGYHEAAPGALLATDKVDVMGRAFRVVPVNGHSMDHVAYLDERENGLYSGDAYMGKFKAARVAEDLHTGIASLRRMADLDPAMLFPAHGPALPRPRERLLDTVAYFEDLARRAWALHDRGIPARRIAKEILPGTSVLTRISLGEFSETNLVTNLLRQRP